MSAPKTTPAIPLHPVVLLARAIGFLVGVLVAAAHTPIVWASFTGVAAYAFTLWAVRANWPAAAPAAPRRP
ncbi:MAG: hypothetical protein ACREOE_03105 [Gemmatimonadales bacterium]